MEEKVNAVARRKVILLIVMLILSVLLLSPWAFAPTTSMPERQEATGTPSPAEASAPSERPDAPMMPVGLKVVAALPEAEFDALRMQGEERAGRLPGVTVEFVRLNPDDAYQALLDASRRGEPVDVMLVENEWVKSFAVAGHLMPADGAFVGEALSEQLEALISPLKWNGYVWGVPRDFDPYVFVWNVPVWKSVAGGAALRPPQSVEGWQQLAARVREQFPQTRWLAISGDDPFAMLTWIQAAGGNHVALDDNATWQGTPAAEALALLDRERSGVDFSGDWDQIAGWLSAGRLLAALMPYSETVSLLARPLDDQPDALALDHATWQFSTVWPRGRSFVISSRSAHEEAARNWVAVMTESTVQQQNYALFGKLPVYRSLYSDKDIYGLSALFPSGGGATAAFPYRSPSEEGPDLPERLQRIGGLWREFASGTIGVAAWPERWAHVLADAEFDN
jgi:ABC-type glycerol-3-phosphate transport system substrate-binding protein